MKIALETLGCKLNQAETESLARQLAEAGHRLVDSVGDADIYILNTCTVTQTADAKSRHLLRLAHRCNPNARLVATGCYAQRAADMLSGIEGVSLVVGNDEKPQLLRALSESPWGLEDVQSKLAPGYEYGNRTRSFIKIQDGCSKFCAYCIVPLVRGMEKSQSAGRIVTAVRNRVVGGVKEVVLTGTEVGAYDDNGIGLKTLLERILAETDIIRLRLSSLQPQEIFPGLISLWSDRRLCPHFHLSLQSGSDFVLKRMKRLYSADDYQRAVSLIRDMVPDAAITTDIITGFPGETSDEFQESCNFCRQMGFARIHIFPYSPRQGTESALMPSQVKDKVKRQRNQELLALAEESALDFRRRFSDRIMSVLWEQESDGLWSGHTDNYIKVYTRSDDDLSNQCLPVRLGKTRGDGVWGEVVGI